MSLESLHPERIAGSDDVIWVTNLIIQLPLGDVQSAPGQLGELLRSAVIRFIAVEPRGLRIGLAPEHSWQGIGNQIRTHLQEALGRLSEWEIVSTATPSTSNLHDVVLAVLQGPAGEVIRLHGGTAKIISVQNDEVVLELGGTCKGCPAIGYTMFVRLEKAIREQYPKLVSVKPA